MISTSDGRPATGPNRRQACLSALFALALGGCASWQDTPAVPASAWQTGRMGVLVAGTDVSAPRSFSAGFELRGSDEAGELRLTGPLGTRVAQAIWTPGRVTLQDAAGLHEYASLDQLSRDTFGEPLPLGAMTWWLQGVPSPLMPSAAMADPAGFTQMGWMVDTSALADRSLIVARRASVPAVTVRVRLDDTSAPAR